MIRMFRRFTVFYGGLIMVILIISTWIGVSTYHIEHQYYNKNDYHNLIRNLYDKSSVQSVSTSNYWKSITKQFITKSQLIFPNGINLEDPKQYILENRGLFNESSVVGIGGVDPSRGRVKFPSTILINNVQDVGLYPSKSSYQPFNLTLFKSDHDIGLDLAKCKELQSTNAIEIDNPIHIDLNMRTILLQFLHDLPTNQYYQELAPFFLTELKLQLKHNIIEHYWYRLAGSSVWLEQYGVHLMISRVLYSPRGIRNQPIVSLMYAQIFNEQWQELTNTELIVPSNDQKFRVMKFPQFLPMPFYHDYDNTVGKYYGPEDPRIILVKNRFGYEEPLIIFNAYHRKLIGFDDDSDEYVLKKPQFYRSMFVCWPFQYQLGKTNMDVLDQEYKSRIYSRVLELKIKNLPRQRTQKNWTPFKSFTPSNTKHSFDNYLYFVYRWANFETLKCSLSSGICGFNYRLDKDLSPMARVGPLRGGTQLVNLNELISTQTSFQIDDFLPPGREIWLGFARAHIDNCGCGSNMYRPNLVIVVKDTIKINPPKLFGLTDRNENEGVYYEDVYRVSHVSSSISFNIPLIGWDLFNPHVQCAGSSILIPNGISAWAIKTTNEGDHDFHNWKFEDYLTLSMSISDFTVHTINIKGLLKQVLQLNSLFLSPPSSDEGERESLDNELQIPGSISGADSKLGFNNDNVVCALQSSFKFCGAYAYEQDKLLSKSLLNNHKNDDYKNKYYDVFMENSDANEIQAYTNELIRLKPPTVPPRQAPPKAQAAGLRGPRPGPGKGLPPVPVTVPAKDGARPVAQFQDSPSSSKPGKSSTNNNNVNQKSSQRQKQAQKANLSTMESSQPQPQTKSGSNKLIPPAPAPAPMPKLNSNNGQEGQPGQPPPSKGQSGNIPSPKKGNSNRSPIT